MESIKKDPETSSSSLSARERALVDFAVRLTRSPDRTTREDLDVLRGHGLSDEDLFILVHVVGYFNHINRVADALGVDLEAGMPPSPFS